MAPRLVAGTRFIGLAVIALGVFLVVEGDVLIGLLVLLASVPLTWLTGVWVVPWSADAYLGKILGVIGDCDANLNYISVRRREGLRGISGEIENLAPPKGRVETHQAIITCVRRIENILGDQSASFVDRAVGVVGPGRVLRKMGDELDSASAEVYTDVAAGSIRRYLQLADESKSKTRESLARLGVRISRIRAPRSLSKSHSEYLAVVEKYISAMNVYCAMREAGEDEVRTAAANVEESYAKLKLMSSDYLRVLYLRTRRIRGAVTATMV